MTLLAVVVWFYPLGFFVALALALLCGYIASAKGHSGALWGILGFFFTLITLIIVLLLPNRATT